MHGHCIYTFILPQLTWLWGSVGESLSVCLAIFLVSSIPPKQINQYWWSFTQSQYKTWGYV